MKSTHCFPKKSLGTYMIVQKIGNSLTHISFFFFREKMKSIPEKKLKHNIRQRVVNSVVKGRNACVEKGFNAQFFFLFVSGQILELAISVALTCKL